MSLSRSSCLFLLLIIELLLILCLSPSPPPSISATDSTFGLSLMLPGWSGFSEEKESLDPSPRVQPHNLCYTFIALQVLIGSSFLTLF